jgi:hypothetical protein
MRWEGREWDVIVALVKEEVVVLLMGEVCLRDEENNFQILRTRKCRNISFIHQLYIPRGTRTALLKIEFNTVPSAGHVEYCSNSRSKQLFKYISFHE